MVNRLPELKAQLVELAPLINAFKSEAVQLRLVDFIFGLSDEVAANPAAVKFASGRKEDLKKTVELRDAPAIKNASRKGRPGGKATLAKLYDEGFFKKPKTINEIVEYCDLNLALKYEQSEFSGGLGRYVRGGKLTRRKNENKQYSYSQS